MASGRTITEADVVGFAGLLRRLSCASSGRKPARGTLIMHRSVLNQRDEVVVEGTWKIVVRTRFGAAEEVGCRPT